MDRLEIRTKFAGRTEKFRPDGFDTDLYIRALSGADRGHIIKTFKILEKSKDDDDVFERITVEAQCYIIARGLINESGSRIYQDDEVQAIADEFPCKVMDELSDKILQISGMKQKQEDLVKNSEPAPNAPSISVLQ